MEIYLWLVLQNLILGLERKPLKLFVEVKKKHEEDHWLRLVVKGRNPKHKNPSRIKLMMPKVWHLEGHVTSIINKDGSVQTGASTFHSYG